MPRSTRDWAKRKIEEATKNLDWCGYHLNEVQEIYKEQHPDIAQPLIDTLQTLVLLDNVLTKVRNSI